RRVHSRARTVRTFWVCDCKGKRLRVVVQLLFKEHPKGRSLTWLLCLLTLAGHIGLALTPRVALPGENLPMYFTQTAHCQPPPR
ncbi:hypothetical protein AVEN_28096-1, partial [Araneus ventricosus]